MSRLGLFARGLLVRFVLDRIAAIAARGPRVRRRRAERRADPRRSPLLPVALGAFGLGLPIMILFEHWATRVVGVLLMFTFIVAGVFLVASPTFLDQEDE